MPKASSSAAKKPIQQNILSKAVEAAVSRKSTSDAFDRELAKLNAEQRRAVETIEGPVMVIAGPGTGKTQVLAMRVAQILRKTQAKPRNILCLTFSTSGATAMRERLRSLIGADAYGVTVSTIHGYCNDLIASHPNVFEDWAAKEQISDVERYRELNKIIDQFLPDLKLVNMKSPYSRSSEILSAISTLKREGKSDPEELRSVVREYEKEMQGKSKPETKQHEKNLSAARKFKEFIEIFIAYQQMLRDTGRYDYDDMILNVIAALKEHDEMLASEQERFLYFLVDEFQDTNGSQYQVIDLLTKPRTPEDKPNLFVVGDDDQAIYRFQGANLQNILSFHDRFPSAPVIALTTSYRSTQAILDAAMSLIERNEERLVGKIPGLEKNLKAAPHQSPDLAQIAPMGSGAGQPSGEQDRKPILLHCASDKAEPWIIADLIEDRIAAGISPEEIAIFAQTNNELPPLYEVLRARGIPVQMTGKVDLLQHSLVCQVLTILDAIHSLDNHSVASALSCACFGCHPADLGRIFQLARDRETSIYRLLQEFDVPNKQDPVALHDRDALLNARNILLDLHQKLGSRTIVETLEHVMKDTGILEELRDVEAQKDLVLSDLSSVDSPKSPPSPSGRRGGADPLDIAALQEFFDRVKFRAYEQPSFTFEVFMNDLACYRSPDYGDLRMTYELPHLTKKGVQLLTAHRSKGLEFHTVILVNFRDRHWDRRRGKSGLSLPEDLLFGWDDDQKSFEKSQDERRVAYVAMTRAKRELIMTCPHELTSGDKLRSVSPSAFFAEAGTLPEEPAEMKDPEKASTLLMKPPREIDAEFRAFLLHRIKNFSLSATALEHFLEDPQIFLEQDLLQLPRAKKPEFAYGNAVHDALKHWGMKRREGVDLDESQFIEGFSAYLRGKEILTNAERARLQKLGEESLPRYFQTRLANAANIIHVVEYPIAIHMNDIPLKGKIDRIDLLAPDSTRSRLIDFKTGRPKTESEIRDGNYLRQLTFYALLMEHGMPFLQPESFTLDFIGEGTDHPIERTFEITTQEKKDLEAVLADVWAKILALDFTSL